MRSVTVTRPKTTVKKHEKMGRGVRRRGSSNNKRGKKTCRKDEKRGRSEVIEKKQEGW